MTGFRPPLPQQLTIAGPAGGLEALLEEPTGAPFARFAVICHPHPQHGGTMHNKVVHTLARVLQEQGVATVRFNYRGVGASGGSYDAGAGETADALAVVAWGRARWPLAALVLAGFSFGAMVSLQASATARPAALISVAPAVTRLEITQLARPHCPWLIVQGDSDEIVDSHAVQAWSQRFSPPPTLRLLPGVDHFFHGRLHELKSALADTSWQRSPSPLEG